MCYSHSFLFIPRVILPMVMTENLAKCYDDLFTRGFSGAEEAKLQKYTNTKIYICILRIRKYIGMV